MDEAIVVIRTDDLKEVFGFDACSRDNINFLRKHNILEDLAKKRKAFEAGLTGKVHSKIDKVNVVTATMSARKG